MKKLLLSSIVIVPLISTMLLADEITDQIDAATQSYKDKNYKEAIDELKYAITSLQKLDAEVNKGLLPAPLEGWEQKNTNSGENPMMAMLGGGATTSAIYAKGDQQVEITILANSPMVASLGMLINNPMLLQSDPKQEPYRYQKAKGIIKKDEKNIEITLLLAGQILITLKGENLENESILESYLHNMDLKKIQMEFLQ